MRLLVLAILAACGRSPAPAASRAPDAEIPCTRVARHVIKLGPVEQWIAEGHEQGWLPVGGVADREGVEKFFEVACQENWHTAFRRCVVAQSTWPGVTDACSNDKVWWYQPR